jgi:hypothetical protein
MFSPSATTDKLPMRATPLADRAGARGAPGSPARVLWYASSRQPDAARSEDMSDYVGPDEMLLFPQERCNFVRKIIRDLASPGGLSFENLGLANKVTFSLGADKTKVTGDPHGKSASLTMVFDLQSGDSLVIKLSARTARALGKRMVEEADGLVIYLPEDESQPDAPPSEPGEAIS